MSATTGVDHEVISVVPVDAVLSRLDGLKKTKKGYSACCPAHEDSSPSLAISVRKGRLYFTCRAGCTEQAVTEALSIEPAQRVSGAGKQKRDDRPPPPPLTEAKVEEWHAALLKNEKTLRHVTETLKLSLDVVKALKLGLKESFDHHERWLMYPYRAGDGWTYAKSRALDGQKQRFGLEPWGQKHRLYRGETLTDGGVAVLFEGERDAASALTLKLHELLPDSPAIVAMPGASHTDVTVGALRTQRLVYLATDNDAAGEKAASELASLLGPERCRRVRFGEYKDLGDLLAEKGTDATAEALSAFTDAPQPVVARRFELSDAGNGERFAARYANRLRCVHYPKGGRRWLVWDETRWAPDKVGQVEQFAVETARSIQAEAETEPDAARADALRKWAYQSESDAHLNAMIRRAQSNPLLRAVPTDFDRNGDLINCRNGTFDLSTGKLRDHDRADMLTRVLNASYRPEAEAPDWLDFVNAQIPNDDVRAFAQRAVGYSLTGDRSEKMLFFCMGPPNSGKTTFVQVIADDLMGEYSRPMPKDLMLARHGSKHEEEVASLWGMRLVYLAEVSKKDTWDVDRVKLFTGGDTLSARQMYGERTHEKPTHKLWAYGNSKPQVPGGDDAFWLRIPIISFANEVPAEKQDRELKDKLLGELDGILAWGIKGALEFMRRGRKLEAPEAVTRETDAYREEEDKLAPFLAEMCVFDTRADVATGVLYHAYRLWCDTNNERYLYKNDFSSEIVRRAGVAHKTIQNVRSLTGLRLRVPGESTSSTPTAKPKKQSKF